MDVKAPKRIFQYLWSSKSHLFFGILIHSATLLNMFKTSVLILVR